MMSFPVGKNLSLSGKWSVVEVKLLLNTKMSLSLCFRKRHRNYSRRPLAEILRWRLFRVCKKTSLCLKRCTLQEKVLLNTKKKVGIALLDNVFANYLRCLLVKKPRWVILIFENHVGNELRRKNVYETLIGSQGSASEIYPRKTYKLCPPYPQSQ